MIPVQGTEKRGRDGNRVFVLVIFIKTTQTLLHRLLPFLLLLLIKKWTSKGLLRCIISNKNRTTEHESYQ
jgi:hypothetical protein